MGLLFVTVTPLGDLFYPTEAERGCSSLREVNIDGSRPGSQPVSVCTFPVEEKVAKVVMIKKWLLVLGVVMLAVYTGAYVQRSLLSRIELSRFKSQHYIGIRGQRTQLAELSIPDVSLWSEKRISDYHEALALPLAPAIAILRIPKIHLEVPVLKGTDELTLNRGVGQIAGTANPEEDGNIGIAGHRDGFFRGLKDINSGDVIELITARGSSSYQVDRIFVVDPKDVSVLAPRRRSITLVTCYPFYFIGSAPKRYIVQATRY